MRVCWERSRYRLTLLQILSYVTMAVPQYFQIFGVFFLVISLFYFSILAFLGGALGGALGVMIRHPAGNLPVQEKKA